MSFSCLKLDIISWKRQDIEAGCCLMTLRNIIFARIRVADIGGKIWIVRMNCFEPEGVYRYGDVFGSYRST